MILIDFLMYFYKYHAAMRLSFLLPRSKTELLHRVCTELLSSVFEFTEYLSQFSLKISLNWSNSFEKCSF